MGPVRAAVKLGLRADVGGAWCQICGNDGWLWPEMFFLTCSVCARRLVLFWRSETSRLGNSPIVCFLAKGPVFQANGGGFQFQGSFLCVQSLVVGCGVFSLVRVALL